jgi:hypothetical protein
MIIKIQIGPKTVMAVKKLILAGDLVTAISNSRECNLSRRNCA